MTVSIVVPTYQERANVPELLSRISQAAPWGERWQPEVIVVDGGSPDGTACLARKIAKSWRGVRVVERGGRRGVADAVRAGLRLAQGDVLGVMDADLQHPPECLGPALERIASGCDLVVLSRHVAGARIAHWSQWRRALSWGSTMVAWLLVPRSRLVRDPLSGFFLMTARMRELALDGGRGSKVLLSILARCGSVRIAELPYTFRPRERGRSKLGVRAALADARLVLSLASRPPAVRRTNGSAR